MYKKQIGQRMQKQIIFFIQKDSTKELKQNI